MALRIANCLRLIAVLRCFLLLTFFRNLEALAPLAHLAHLAPLEPESGVWFGVNMDNQVELEHYPRVFGVNPVTVGTFIELPMRGEDFLFLREFLDQVVDCLVTICRLPITLATYSQVA